MFPDFMGVMGLLGLSSTQRQRRQPTPLEMHQERERARALAELVRTNPGIYQGYCQDRSKYGALRGKDK